MVTIFKGTVAFLLIFYMFKINKLSNNGKYIKNRVEQMKRLNKWEEI